MPKNHCGRPILDQLTPLSLNLSHSEDSNSSGTSFVFDTVFLGVIIIFLRREDAPVFSREYREFLAVIFNEVAF